MTEVGKKDVKHSEERYEKMSEMGLIDKKDVIDYLNELLDGRFRRGEEGLIQGIRDNIRFMPSAQPEKEKAKRVLWTGWKGHRDTRYKCPNCKKPVKNDDIYCHRCGQKLMFPHISFTDYVPGEKQETIVRWDDE